MRENVQKAAAALDLDLVEKVIIAVMFLFFAMRMSGAYLDTGNVLTLVMLFNEAILIVFVLARRRTQAISRKASDWFLGFAGTTLPLLLLPPSGDPLLPLAACGVLMLIGTAIHLSAKLTLRRSFGVVAANRGVKASGLYAVVRHPMYAGYMLVQAGLLLSGPNLVNAVILAGAWSLQIGRILAEERILGEDPQYRELVRRTPYRLFPGVF